MYIYAMYIIYVQTINCLTQGIDYEPFPKIIQ